MASSRPSRIDAVQASMLRRAASRAASSRPSECTSAPQQRLVLDDDHVDAVTPQQPDGRRRDRGGQHLLHAAEHQRDPLRLGHVADRRFRLGQLRIQPLARHQLKRGGEVRMAHARDQRAERPHHPAKHEREAEGVRVRHHLAQDEAQGALGGAAVRLHLDAGAGELDEMHVVHAARTGGHAGLPARRGGRRQCSLACLGVHGLDSGTGRPWLRRVHDATVSFVPPDEGGSSAARCDRA